MASKKEAPPGKRDLKTRGRGHVTHKPSIWHPYRNATEGRNYAHPELLEEGNLKM